MQVPYTAQDSTTIYCPQCGGPMRVAPEHMQAIVTCPHCERELEPSRLVGLATTPTQPPPAPQYAYGRYGAVPYSWRNRWIAGALGILLGGFGVHRFYLGYVGIGIVQIIVTVMTVGVVGPIWGFIEGILCFCGAIRDADGLPLSG